MSRPLTTKLLDDEILRRLGQPTVSKSRNRRSSRRRRVGD